MDTRSIRALISLLVTFVALRSGDLHAQGRDKDGFECWSPAEHGPWVTSTSKAYLITVGYYFSDGDCGYPRDSTRAVQAWTRAVILSAKQNDSQRAARAAGALAVCYHNGPCPKDYVETYAWANISLVFREDYAARGLRDSLEREVLTRSSLARAQQRSQEILAVLAEAADSREKEEDKPPVPAKFFGTAFFVSSQGHAVTNHHVIEGCRVLTVGGEEATVVADDGATDLAILRAGPKRQHFAKFRDGGGVTAGTSVVVVGYPLPGLLASADPNVTTGVVSALAGPSENRRYFQVTAPIQPGNSGGPLLDSSGHVIGVVVSTLSTVGVANATGAIPQNLNFAIKAPAVRALLESNEIPFQTAKSVQKLEVSDVAARARRYTEQVECTK